MRSVLKVLFGILNTILITFFVSVLPESVDDFLFYFDLESLFALAANLVAIFAFGICFAICVFHGYKSDATDPWAKEKKEMGWLAYAAFVVGTVFFAVGMEVPVFGDLIGFDVFMIIVCVLVAVVFYFLGAFALKELSKYEEMISLLDLKASMKKMTADYTRVDRGSVTYRKYDGDSLEVTIDLFGEGSKVVLDFEPDNTWYTVTGRTVMMYTFEKWAIFVFDKPRHVRVFQSKVHSN